MKTWHALVCPTCGWRYSPQRFARRRDPINYPIEVITGGGRARGFQVLSYLPWSALPAFRGTAIWEGIKSLYDRLAAAYDNYFEVLGFLSPKIRLLLRELRRPYEHSYLTEHSSYNLHYSDSLSDLLGPYGSNPDYPHAYETTDLLHYVV